MSMLQFQATIGQLIHTVCKRAAALARSPLALRRGEATLGECERADDVSRLAHALNRALRRCWDPEHKRFAWPLGEKPIAINGWTGERLELGEACKVAARGHRG